MRLHSRLLRLFELPNGMIIDAVEYLFDICNV